ncbi:hypothetical protein BG015_009807 [Linnemannia schmuckeri]|uniref:ABC transporter domain-containing protein n=1 Tax=Linnemannia schmuckeri TaxID=64567 RepID=A0A9P5V931_9FUNG|nr:hypothetical protein BG015_009807 [Linnemannia schmuckeri]
MFKKSKKGAPAPAGDPHNPHNRLSGNSSSNALVYAQPDDHHHHTHIPMQHLNDPKFSKSSDPHLHEHDPLPPAVDFSNVTPTARYQFRALARRALSYHSRQRTSNICCLVIWPVLLVVLCLIFSLIGGESLSKESKIAAFCVNDADPTTSRSFKIEKIPAGPNGSKRVPASWYPASLWASRYDDALPCVRWFGESFPRKAPYENTTVAGAAQPDSFYTPSPVNGWFDLPETREAWYKKNGNQNYDRGSIAFFNFNDVNQTVYITTANAQVAQAVGSSPKLTPKFESKVWPPTNASIVYSVNTTAGPNSNAGTGLLGSIPIRFATSEIYRQNKTDPNSGESIKVFTPQAFTILKDQATANEVISAMVKNLAGKNGYMDYKVMPFGALHFDAVDSVSGKLKATMQFGQGPSETQNYLSVPSGLRQMITITQLTNSIVKTKFSGKYSISQGLRTLPFEWDSSISNGYVLNQLSLRLFPFALCFLMPTFVSILVQEKEDRHRMMMAMNGLKNSSYYIAHYVEFLTMQLILSLFFCLTCAAISSQIILRTNPVIILAILILWAHVQTTLSFLFGSLFSKTRRATLIVYFFVAISCIMGAVTDTIFKDGIPTAWFIHPSFAFFYILSEGVSHASRTNGMAPLVWADFAPGKNLFFCAMILIGESFLALLLTFYIDAVAPSEYGVQKPWHFPISSFFKRNNTSADPESHLAANHNSPLPSDDVLEGGDADVYAERERVQTKYDPATTPLIINNLYHCYRGKVEAALKGMSFGVETNTVLGLLGPNGAGKSTMIHLLTGLYSPTSGTAHVAGANIRTDMSTVHARIGVCPQHDILWGDLTVADHLLFYARLRGIPPSLEKQAVEYAVASVSLTKFHDRQVKGLSGGEKRRVSIAIALLGDNRVIFLDEPSTGLDPHVRRVIWDIVNRVKVGRTLVLTTHSMEEADILSDRIAIMTSGRLRCIGTSLHLKDLYGSGFRLNVSSKPGRLEEACQSVERQILTGLQYRRIDKFTNATTFEFDFLDQQRQNQHQHQNTSAGHRGYGHQERGQLSNIFSLLSRPGQFPAIEDWGLSQTTLEDVFVKIVTEGDSDLAMPTIASA